MELFDSHAHYNDARFDEEYPGGRECAIRDACTAGVTGILNAGTNPSTSRESVRLAEEYPFFYAAAGLHPSDVSDFDVHFIQKALDEIRTIASHPKCVAIGEIGLDYYWTDENKNLQKEVFDRQLSMAEELNLPVIIHDRDAHGDSMDIVFQHPNVHGVFHSFSGSPEMARQLLRRGWFISFSGPITYKNANKVREAARIVPKDRILIETDAPYLPPVPHRGEINFSGYLIHTASALADVLEISVEEVAHITKDNALHLFSI